MVLLNDIILLGMGVTPGLAQPDGMDNSPREVSVTAAQSYPSDNNMENARGISQATDDLNLDMNVMKREESMVQVPEEDLQDLLEDIKDLEDQVVAMMAMSENDKVTIGPEDEEECLAEDSESLGSRSDEVSGTPLRRNTKCAVGSSVAPQQMIELSDSETAGSADDISSESAPSTSSVLTGTPSTTPTEDPTGLLESESDSADATPVVSESLLSDSLQPSSTLEELKTVVLTSTKTTKSTTTITQTHTRTISLAIAPGSTESPVASEDVDGDIDVEENVEDDGDTEDEAMEDEAIEDEETEDGEEDEPQQPAPAAFKVPLPVDIEQTFPNTTTKQSPPVAEAIPVASRLSPTPAPEQPAATPAALPSTPQKFLKAAAANITERALAFSGFKTVTTPGWDGSGRTVQ